MDKTQIISGNSQSVPSCQQRLGAIWSLQQLRSNGINFIQYYEYILDKNFQHDDQFFFELGRLCNSGLVFEQRNEYFHKESFTTQEIAKFLLGLIPDEDVSLKQYLVNNYLCGAGNIEIIIQNLNNIGIFINELYLKKIQSKQNIIKNINDFFKILGEIYYNINQQLNNDLLSKSIINNSCLFYVVNNGVNDAINIDTFFSLIKQHNLFNLSQYSNENEYLESFNSVFTMPTIEI